MQQFSDEQLMRMIMEKQSTALEEMYDRYAKLVYSFAMKANRDTQFAKEVVQLVFTRLWTTTKGYDPQKGQFVNWLLTVTRNISIDQLRKLRKQAAVVPYEPSAWERLPDHPHEHPEEIVSRKWRKQHIELAYRYLSDSQVRLIQALYWEGYTLSEIAEQSGEPLGTVKSRLHQTLKILRKHLGPARGEGFE
ncbi:sigma-70 family RNA polymerase sigma factor [Paenibacillus allorhizosphaerae]|uniref:ECF RNA polymerase sigma factor RpoE n=1 Tax=Paenibacillus allorhizosphaerae TaxID=2849866 RepID=A0ABN7TKT2_9BACL|nr:sigma-70 family RNA polymerase sigma factor [Paenibacillus allorhizosphaerae]CAG7644462.1 ECF RNA polymerase sigma factor RpoE [Paenibacillus allorhizosphaerae]